MVERQPGRPTEQEFIGAALRFIENDYQYESIVAMTSYFAHVYRVSSGRMNDICIIQQEHSAEGREGEPVSLRDFAIEQLAAYRKLRKH